MSVCTAPMEILCVHGAFSFRVEGTTLTNLLSWNMCSLELLTNKKLCIASSKGGKAYVEDSSYHGNHTSD